MLVRFAALVACEVRDVFQHEKRGASVSDDPEEMLAEQIASEFAFGAELLTRLREWLARKPGSDDVMLRHRGRADGANVGGRGDAEVLRVKRLKAGIDFAGEHTLPADPGQANVKPTESGEEIDESEWCLRGVHCSGNTRVWRADVKSVRPVGVSDTA